METKFKLIKRTSFEEIIKNGNKKAMESLKALKEKALEEAIINTNFYTDINDKEKADNEFIRVQRLNKDIKELTLAINK